MTEITITIPWLIAFGVACCAASEIIRHLAKAIAARVRKREDDD